jgi:hypothetical protein
MTVTCRPGTCPGLGKPKQWNGMIVWNLIICIVEPTKFFEAIMILYYLFLFHPNFKVEPIRLMLVVYTKTLNFDHFTKTQAAISNKTW